MYQKLFVSGRQGAQFTYEVIVVNDGSVDGTSAVAFDFIRRFGFDAVRLLQLPQNCGKVKFREGPQSYAVSSVMLCPSCVKSGALARCRMVQR